MGRGLWPRVNRESRQTYSRSKSSEDAIDQSITAGQAECRAMTMASNALSQQNCWITSLTPHGI